MENGVLRNWPAIQIDGQHTSVPALAVFNNRLWMAYKDTNSDFIYVTSSADGLSWDGATEIGYKTTVPAMVAFNNMLWMVTADPNTMQLYVTNSADGRVWSSALPIVGQFTSVPALAVFNDALWMVYSGSNSSQLYTTSSTDGLNWPHVQPIDGQSTSIPAIATFNNALWMVYSDSRSSQLWVTCSSDGNNWSQAQQIEAQGTSVPALTVFQSALWMVYTDSNSSQLWVSTSSNGLTWIPAAQIEGQFTSIPAIAPFADRICMTYTDSHSSQLWASRSLDGWNWHLPDMPNPTQAMLEQYCDVDFYLQIDPNQYGGQGLTTPQYYAVQEFSDHIEITYLIICAYNGHQTCNALRVGSEFYCIIDDYARHPGDLERVTVKLALSAGGYAVTDVCFESHGDATDYAAAAVSFSGQRVIVHSSLNAHGTFNQKATGDWISKKKIAGVADFGDALSSDITTSKVWTPSEYRLIGLDASNNPIGSEVWVKFGGRLGQPVDNSFTGSRYFNGDNLDFNDWNFVNMNATLAGWLGLISDEMKYGLGPVGPAGRPYIRPA